MSVQRKVPPAVQAERREENERLSFTPSSAVHETTIRSTHIYMDRDEYVVLEFETLQRAYAIIIIVTDRREMSLAECRAVGDVLKLGSRGSQMDNALFFSSCANFRHRYGLCEGPVVENDRLVCLIEPSSSNNAHAHATTTPASGREKSQVRSIELAFDSEFDLVLTAHTECESYTVVLALEGNQGALHVADCEALCVLFAILEPGERIDLTEFLCHLASLRESLGFLRLARIKRNVSCIMFASKARNNEDIPKQIQSALMVRERRLAAAQAESAAVAANAAPAQVGPTGDLLIPPNKPPPLAAVPGAPMYPTPSIQGEQVGGVPLAVAAPVQLVQTPPASPMPCCPYPDMVYTRALTESGQAQVYAGEKLSSGEKVAIKVFLGTGNSAGSTFRLELRMLLKMPEHPNVIEVLDFFEYPRPALVTRLIEGGGDMLEHIRKHGAIPAEDSKLIAAELADGVLHLHRSGIVHRDLKSANVLLKAKPNSTRLTPVIIDLGLGAARGKNNSGKMPQHYANEADLARTFAAVTLTEKTQGMKGTPFWMCPEMVRNQEWSEKTDVYAFGIILWEMLSGKQPFSHIVVRDQWDLMWRILHGERPDINAIINAPDELQSMVQRCWAQDPKERPTMQQVVDQLRGQDPEAIFRSIDVDNSNSIDFAELVGFLGRYAPETSPGEMYPIFLGLDVNHSGAISLQEFIRFWNIVTNKGIHIALKECQNGLSR